MPTYKVLSKEELQKWRDKLTEMVSLIIENPTDEAVRIFMLEFYEYIQMSIGYKYKYNLEDKENVVVTYTDVKNYYKEYDKSDEKYVVSFFNNVANSIRHNYASVDFKKYFSNLYDSKQNIYISSACADYLVGMEVVSEFFSNKERLQVLYKELYDRNSAYKECEGMVYAMLRSGMTLDSVVNSLKCTTLYSDSFIKSILFDILKEFYVTEGSLT